MNTYFPPPLGCTHNGDTYAEGESYQPYGLRDPCVECTCAEGEFKCDTKECPAVDCTNAVAELGQCCDVCPSKQTGFDIFEKVLYISFY